MPGRVILVSGARGAYGPWTGNELFSTTTDDNDNDNDYDKDKDKKYHGLRLVGNMIHYNIHPVNPQRHMLEQTAAILKNGDGICVYPTDTVYGLGCCADNPKAIDKIARFMEKDRKRLFSFICADFSQVSRYARLDNAGFKLLKHYLPGPFTFILTASHIVPKKICPKRKTVGIRIPDCRVVQELVRLLGVALANTSVKLPGELRGDPDNVKPAALNEVDVMLDIGVLDNPVGSTIVDLTGGAPVVVREGKGVFNG